MLLVSRISLLFFVFFPITFLIHDAGKISAQNFSDRLNTEASFFSTAASEKDQSFWLITNRYGMFDDASANALTLISGELQMREEKFFDVGGGVDILARASQESKFYFHQAYLEAKMGSFNLNAGFKETTLGYTYKDLTSGSAIMSNNARPIPRVLLTTPEFFEVPFTKGWVEAKGHFSHGWLNDDRLVQDAYIHDKSFYLQTGGDSGFKFYAGMVHIAIWGGECETRGKLPSSFSDFIKIIFAQQGGEDAPGGEQINALGFHTGIWDWGLKTKLSSAKIHLYYQHLFTDGSGMRYQNFGDGLFGIGVSDFFKSRWITGVNYEILNTTDQSGPGLPDRAPYDSPDFCDEPNCGYPYGGRDNYYNNSIYRSGLSYYGMSIGSPFFLTQRQLDKVDPNINTYSTAYFVSTRNFAHHFGIRGELSESLSYKLLTSFVKYYGTYHGKNFGTAWGSRDPENNPEDYFFNPSQNQWYFLLETNWHPRNISKLKITIAVAADRGDLFNNYGFMLGINWNLINSKE